MIELRIATATVGTTTIIHMSASVPGVMSTKVKSPGVVLRDCWNRSTPRGRVRQTYSTQSAPPAEVEACLP